MLDGGDRVHESAAPRRRPARSPSRAPAPAGGSSEVAPVPEAGAEGRKAAPAPLSALTHRHLLGIQGLTPEEITLILDTARAFAEVSTRAIKKVPTLRG